MVYDLFSAHKTDDMKALLATNNTGFIIIPGDDMKVLLATNNTGFIIIPDDMKVLLATNNTGFIIIPGDDMKVLLATNNTGFIIIPGDDMKVLLATNNTGFIIIPDDMKVLLATNNTGFIIIPGGCTLKCQPLDVSINKPFKAVLRNCWEDYVTNFVTNLSEEEQQNEDFRLASPSRQDIINWVAEGFEFLKTRTKMIQKSFLVCGITTTDPDKIWTDLLKNIMSKANDKIADEEIEFEGEDPFADLDVDESDVNEVLLIYLHFKTLLFSFFDQRMY